MIKYILIMISSVLIASVAQVLLKKSANRKYTNIMREYVNIFVIFGYLLMFISSMLTVLSYKGLEFKYGSILESIGYILLLIFGKVFFNEKITHNKIIGISLIMIGIFIFCI